MSESSDLAAVPEAQRVARLLRGDVDGLLKAAIEQAGYGVMLASAGQDDGSVRIVYVNQGFSDLTGYDRAEALGNSLGFLHGPQTDPDTLAALDHALAEGRPFEGRLTSYDRRGHELLLDWRVSPVLDEEGRTPHWLCTLINVGPRAREEASTRASLQHLVKRAEARTYELAKINLRLNREIADRETAEAAQRQIQARYDSAIRAGNVGLWEWDILSDDLFIDPHLKSMLGYRDDEISNHMQAWLEHVHPDDRDKVRSEYAAHLEGRTEEFLSEHRMLHKDGSVRWFFARGNALRNEKGIAYRMSGSHNDITLRKKFEHELNRAKDEAESANRAKSDFLASVSHELRTPLNAILGFSEILKEQTFGPIGLERYVDYARDIHESGSHLLSLINDILDISKIEAGKFKLERERFDLAEIIGDCLRLTAVPAETAGIEMRQSIDAMPPVFADRRALKQALLNVLSNAVKFTDPGGRVEVRARAEAERVVIEVEDNGIGIPEEDIGRLGQVFVQVDHPSRQRREGTGLGLAITSSIVKMHGGKFAIESKLGEGTKVTIALPQG